MLGQTREDEPEPCFLCGEPSDYPGVWSYLREMRPMPLCRACLEKVPTWDEEVAQLAEVG